MRANKGVTLRRSTNANRVPLGALVMLCVVAGCAVGGAKLTGPGDAPQTPAVAAASVSLSAPTTQLTTSTSLPLRAVALDASGDTLSGTSFTWSSSNPNVAAVSSDGVVSGQQAGTASITASTGSITSNAVAMTVTAPSGPGGGGGPSVATIAVTAPSSSVGLLQSLQAQAVAYDASGNIVQGIAFTWSSSNTAAATVSNTGLITARLVGTTQIKAASGSVTSTGFTVTVTP
jgi:uncharacterized protein YjdB